MQPNRKSMRKLLIFLIALLLVLCCDKPTKRVSVTDTSLDFSYISSYDTTEQDLRIKKTFYKAVGTDTFHYAVTEDDSVFLWAIVRGEGVHLIRDL